MMNEGHNGWSRCSRTRRVGEAVLPAAHDMGCRHFAMEALPNRGSGPSLYEEFPGPHGFLAQPDMAALVHAALALGWTLIAYEAQRDLAPPTLREDTLAMPSTNWREAQQATNLTEALHQLDDRTPMLVWCGNGHHTKTTNRDWIPMGYRFRESSGVDPFCIDQLATVSLDPERRPWVPITAELRRVLGRLGGTAGFTRDDPPNGYVVPPWYDASVLSLDNEMVGPPPRSPQANTPTT